MLRRTISILGCVLAVFLCLWADAWAAAAPAHDPVELPEVLVSPRRVPGLSVDADSYPGHATTLTRTAIERSGAQTIQELLARQAGVHLIDQQGFGLASDTGVNLRGVINSSRTNALVLIDGIRQNRLTGDEVHWLSIPLEHVERIEIIRGGGATIYGEGALAGVINIITRQEGDRAVETDHLVEAGTFGWQRYHSGARGRAESWTYAAQATRFLVDGYRERSWSRASTVSGHAGVELTPGLSARLHMLHSDDTTAFPGLLNLVEAQQRREGTNAFHGFNVNEVDQTSLDVIAGPAQGWSGVLTTYWRRRVQHSEDSFAFNSFTITPSRGVSLRMNHDAGLEAARNLLVAGTEFAWDKATAGDPGLGEDSESTRRGHGFYAENTLTLWDRLTVSGGLRYDRSRFQESLTFPAFTGTLRFEGWSPKLALSYAVIPETLSAFASYARPFKAPNVDDFSVRSVEFTANPTLRPQEAETYEAGLRARGSFWNASATGFFIRTNDEILFDRIGQENQNFDTRRLGAELTTGMDGPRCRARLAYTFVEAEFRKGSFAGNTIGGTPEHTLNVGMDVSPLDGLWVGAQWRLVHDFFRVNDLRNILGGADNYGVLDLTARWALRPHDRWGHGNAYMTVTNVTNEEYSTLQSSNGKDLTGAGEAPMPPIGMLAGVRWEW